MTMITGAGNIAMVRLLALKNALGLEVSIPGIKACRISAATVCKREFGFKGQKKKILWQLEVYINRVQHGEDAVLAADGQWYSGDKKRPDCFEPSEEMRKVPLVAETVTKKGKKKK
jgi:hypothetical protein